MDKDRIEDMLSQLIRMVGSVQSEQTEMKEDISVLKQEMRELNSRVDRLEMKVDENEINSEKRHVETLKKLRELKIDNEFTWEKTVNNEREIERLKKS